METSFDNSAVQREIEALQRQIDLATTPPRRPEGAKPARASPMVRKPQGNLDFLGPTLLSPRESQTSNPLSKHQLQTPTDAPMGTPSAPIGASASEGKPLSGSRVRGGLKLPSPDQAGGAAELGSRARSAPDAEDERRQDHQAKTFDLQTRAPEKQEKPPARAVPRDDAVKFEQDGALEPSFLGGTLEQSGEMDALAFSQDIEGLEFEKDMHTWQLAHVSEENHKLRKANQLLMSMLEGVDAERDQQQEIFDQQQRRLLEQQQLNEQRQRQFFEEQQRMLQQQAQNLDAQQQRSPRQPQESVEQKRMRNIIPEPTTHSRPQASFQPRGSNGDHFPAVFDPAYLSLRNKYLDVMNLIGVPDSRIAHAGMLPQTSTTAAPNQPGTNDKDRRRSPPLRSDGPSTHSRTAHSTPQSLDATLVPPRSSVPASSVYGLSSSTNQPLYSPRTMPPSPYMAQNGFHPTHSSSRHRMPSPPSPPPHLNGRLSSSPPARSASPPPSFLMQGAGRDSRPPPLRPLSSFQQNPHGPGPLSGYNGYPEQPNDVSSPRPAGSRPSSPVPPDSASQPTSPLYRNFATRPSGSPSSPPPVPPPRSSSPAIPRSYSRPKAQQPASTARNAREENDESAEGWWAWDAEREGEEGEESGWERERAELDAVAALEEDARRSYQRGKESRERQRQQKLESVRRRQQRNDDDDDDDDDDEWRRREEEEWKKTGKQRELMEKEAALAEEERALRKKQEELERQQQLLQQREQEQVEQARTLRELHAAISQQHQPQPAVKQPPTPSSPSRATPPVPAQPPRSPRPENTPPAAPQPRLEKPKKSPRGVMAM